MASQMISLYMLQLQQNAAEQQAEIARRDRQAEMDQAQINQAFQMSIQSTNDYFKAQQAMDYRDLDLLREKHKQDLAERKDIREQEEHKLEQKVKFAEHREKARARADRFEKSEAGKDKRSKRHARAIKDTSGWRQLKADRDNALRMKKDTLRQIKATIKQLEDIKPMTYRHGKKGAQYGDRNRTKETDLVDARLQQLKSLEQQATVLDPLDHVGTISQAGDISGQIPSIYNLQSELGIHPTQHPPLQEAGAPTTTPFSMVPPAPQEESFEEGEAADSSGYGYETIYKQDP